MKVNAVLAEMVFELKSNAQVLDAEMEMMSTEPEAAPTAVVGDPSTAPGEVLCDLCTEPRLRALMSCLMCIASFCQDHLQPHFNNPRLRRNHQLIEALPNLEERICPDHGRPLELFCRDHAHFICLECTSAGHKGHKAVPLKQEVEEQLTEVNEQIKKRLIKMEELRTAVDLSQRNADTKIQEGVLVFNSLIVCVQDSLNSFRQRIEEKHRNSEEEATQLIKEIQTEISELEQRAAEMVQLRSSGDHLQFVQTFTSVKPAPQLKDWTEKKVRAPTYEGRVTKALTELERALSVQMEDIFASDMYDAEECLESVTLDPDTAHPNLILSEDLTQVRFSDRKNNLPDNPLRFAEWYCVLGKQKISTGKFYFEVAVGGKTAFEVGVAKESVERKGHNLQILENGYWLLYYSGDGSYKVKCDSMWDDQEVVSPIRPPPEKVGVFVDYDEGVIAFYDAGISSLIWSFTECSFTENLLPLLNPCKEPKAPPMKLNPIGFF